MRTLMKAAYRVHVKHPVAMSFLFISILYITLVDTVILCRI